MSLALAFVLFYFCLLFIMMIFPTCFRTAAVDVFGQMNAPDLESDQFFNFSQMLITFQIVIWTLLTLSSVQDCQIEFSPLDGLQLPKQQSD
jgi:hypothetical protein